MAYVDEKIALLEREARRQEKEAETENTPMEEQQDETRYLTLEEMLEAVREGSVTFPNQEKFEFGFSEVLSEKVPMPLVKDIFTDVEENDDAAIYVDDGYGISQIVTLTDKPITEGSIGDMKKQLEKGMQEMNSYAEVTKEKVLENLDYLISRMPTAKGWIYNISFRLRTASGRVAGNYNCFEKDKNTYGVMLEALVLRLNEIITDGEKVS
ncbi:MAG: hypothetical protein HFI54_09430 [Lachnospiraceae bacterium]|jgi:hypothetical protein|nr:hypothetical protein [Lachnospiraceae bacterium]